MKGKYTFQSVHGRIGHLESFKLVIAAAIFVHGRIGHLETFEDDSFKLVAVHGRIGHLESLQW